MKLFNVVAILILLNLLNALIQVWPGLKAKSIKVESVSVSFVILAWKRKLLEDFSLANKSRGNCIDNLVSSGCLDFVFFLIDRQTLRVSNRKLISVLVSFLLLWKNILTKVTWRRKDFWVTVLGDILQLQRSHRDGVEMIQRELSREKQRKPCCLPAACVYLTVYCFP